MSSNLGMASSSSSATAVVDSKDEYRLAHDFYDAYKASSAFHKVDAEPPSEEDIDALGRKWKSIAYHVIQLRLFSPNEELDDIGTSDLKYLLVPFMLGEVTASTRDMTTRHQALKQSLLFWRAFAADCGRLKVAHNDDLRAIDRSPEDPTDSATKREEKIARYKRSKELDSKAAFLFNKKKEVFGDEFQWGSGSAFDEDMERDLILALLGRAVATVADNIVSAEQELPLLEMMAARGGPGAPPLPAPPVQDKPWMVHIQDKSELTKLYKEMVFQCPYALPTVTLAEFAEAEMAQMQRTKEEKSNHERIAAYEADDRWWGGDRDGAREAAEEEQKTYKDRDWDDWKDEHPYGSGNKMANVG